MDWLWKAGAELYRTKWTRDWSEEPTEMLEKLLGKLSAIDIKLGFGECIKQAQDGKEWPPVPITFISMCKVAGIDVDGSFMRLVNREKPSDEAEKKTRHEVGYNCRSLPDDKARKLWEKNYRKNYQLMKEGKLNLRTENLLTEHVAAKPTDKMRDRFKPSTAESAAMINRINKIRKSKRD